MKKVSDNRKVMNKIKLPKSKSLNTRVFLLLCCSITIIIFVLILLNNTISESYYLVKKEKTLLSLYDGINTSYNELNTSDEDELFLNLEKISINNNFDIVIKNSNNILLYTSNTGRDLIGGIKGSKQNSSTIYSKDNVVINKTVDSKNGLNYVLLMGKLDNGYTVYLRMPLGAIQESVKISNSFLCIIGFFVIVVSALIAAIISKHMTKPIIELSDIANRMSKLDFSKKYQSNNYDDEMNKLGESINVMSNKLETTINKLTVTNAELEKDIEKKYKIDEMRKQFISDVSHELKTPIALIQGYAEGLIELDQDEESKKMYAGIILDESQKMSVLVQKLLELMKLENEKMEFNNINFNVIEVITEILRKSMVMINEKNVTVEIDSEKEVFVTADEFYVEQALNNYIINALKHVKEIDDENVIKISVREVENNKIRVSVFNTGNQIPVDDLSKIWTRFYKVDESRNRDDGGTGLGLAIVKAIMRNSKNNYGVENKSNGVEFYCELNK